MEFKHSRILVALIMVFFLGVLSACGGGGGGGSDSAEVDDEPLVEDSDEPVTGGEDTDDKDIPPEDAPVVQLADLLPLSPVFTCESGDTDIEGCWSSTECTQVVDTDGNFIDYWLAPLLQFGATNNLDFAAIIYSDSACSVLLGRAGSLPFVLGYELPGTIFNDGSGLIARGVNISAAVPGSEPFYDGESAYFVTPENTLCLSENTQLDNTTIRINENLSSDINFSNCLVSRKFD